MLRQKNQKEYRTKHCKFSKKCVDSVKSSLGYLGGDWWRDDVTNEDIYSNSLMFNFVFRKQELPKRCIEGYEYLYAKFLAHLKTKRSRIHPLKVEAVVKSIVKNTSRVKWAKVNGLRYLGNKSIWSNKETNYYNLSYTIFIEMVDWLVAEGYAVKHQGSGGDGYINTTNLLILSDNFIELCCGKGVPKVMEPTLRFENKYNIVIHKRVNKVSYPREIKPEERSQVDKLDTVLSAYNESLEQRQINVCGYDIPEIYFRRIFNEGLDSGGRYYDQGQFLGKSKEERSTTLIDGEGTVSLDFKHLHPSICYELKGIDLKGKDPYKVEVECSINTTLVNAWMEEYKVGTTPNYKRNLAKLALLCMINAKSKSSCMSAITQEIHKDKSLLNQGKRRFVGIYDVKVKALVDALYEHNKEIKEYFYSGHGVVMQNFDSRMIEYCIKVFLSEEEVLIPVHDCIVIKEGLTSFGLDTMEDAYGKVLGSSMNCKIEIE